MSSGESRSIPSGPFDTVRLGWRLYTKARGVLTAQVLTIFLISAVLSFLAAIILGQPFQHFPTGVWQVFVYGLGGVPVIILQVGLMHGIAEVAGGRGIRFQGLAWGFPQRPIWLFAAIVQILLWTGLYVLEHILSAGGIRSTGNPQHPFVFAHGGGPAIVSGLLSFLVIIFLYDILQVAIALQARGRMSLLAGARTVLTLFRRGYRRFLFVSLAWVVVIFGVALLALLVLVLLLLVFGYVLPKAALVIMMPIPLIAGLVAGLIVMTAMPVSYVIAAEVLATSSAGGDLDAGTRALGQA